MNDASHLSSDHAFNTDRKLQLNFQGTGEQLFTTQHVSSACQSYDGTVCTSKSSMMDHLKIPKTIQASIALLSAQLCFSGWHILGSVSFHEGADPLIFCMYRIILGTALMHVYIRICGMKIEIDPVDYQRFFFLGVLSFVSMVFTALSLKFIAPSRFSIFQPTVPCITTGLSMFLGLEQLGTMKILGVAVAVVGAFLAEGGKHHAQQNQNNEANIPLGTAIATAQVFAMGILLVAVKPLLNKYQPAVVSTVYFTIATIATVLLCLARIDIFPFEEYYFRGEIMPWVTMVYAAVFTTLYAFIALSWGGKYLNPSVATVYFTFQPVGTIFLSATILGAGVTLPEIVGGLLIIAGLTITALSVVGNKEEESSLYRHASGIEGAVAGVFGSNNNLSSMHGANNSATKMSVLSAIELTKSAFTNINNNTSSKQGYTRLLTEDWQPTDIENCGSTDVDEPLSDRYITTAPDSTDNVMQIDTAEASAHNDDGGGKRSPEVSTSDLRGSNKENNVHIALMRDQQAVSKNSPVRLRSGTVGSK